MRDRLRRRYQVQKEVARNAYFKGEIPLSKLERLAELRYTGTDGNSSENVSVEFEFVLNEYDLPTIVGRLETRLQLECQRCLGSMEMPIALEFRLLIDASDELVRESSVDTLYSDDGYIDLFDAVEDELILAVPLVAVHEEQSCNEHWPATDEDPGAETKDNPFAVLAQLKTTE